MKVINSEILVNMKRVVELSRRTENQLVLGVPENVTCLSGPGHAAGPGTKEEHLGPSGTQTLT